MSNLVWNISSGIELIVHVSLFHRFEGAIIVCQTQFASPTTVAKCIVRS